MPAQPDDVSSVSSRYIRLAELCRDSAAKARLATVARSLLKLADHYERRASEALAAEPKLAPANAMRSNRVPRVVAMDAEQEVARPLFRFADLKRKAGLGANKAEHGSD